MIALEGASWLSGPAADFSHPWLWQIDYVDTEPAEGASEPATPSVHKVPWWEHALAGNPHAHMLKECEIAIQGMYNVNAFGNPLEAEAPKTADAGSAVSGRTSAAPAEHSPNSTVQAASPAALATPFTPASVVAKSNAHPQLGGMPTSNGNALAGVSIAEGAAAIPARQKGQPASMPANVHSTEAASSAPSLAHPGSATLSAAGQQMPAGPIRSPLPASATPRPAGLSPGSQEASTAATGAFAQGNAGPDHRSRAPALQQASSLIDATHLPSPQQPEPNIAGGTQPALAADPSIPGTMGASIPSSVPELADVAASAQLPGVPQASPATAASLWQDAKAAGYVRPAQPGPAGSAAMPASLPGAGMGPSEQAPQGLGSRPGADLHRAAGAVIAPEQQPQPQQSEFQQHPAAATQDALGLHGADAPSMSGNLLPQPGRQAAGTVHLEPGADHQVGRILKSSELLMEILLVSSKIGHCNPGGYVQVHSRAYTARKQHLVESVSLRVGHCAL